MNFRESLERLKIISDALPDDDPDKLDMLDIEADYSGIMEWALRKYNECAANEAAAKELVKKYTARAARFSSNASSLKDVLSMTLDCAGESSYKGAAGTVSNRKLSQHPIITNEDLIPSEYKKTTVSIDKAAINKAVKEGAAIDGVSLDNGGVSTTVRIN